MRDVSWPKFAQAESTPCTKTKHEKVLYNSMR